jgi:hypothetical protein
MNAITQNEEEIRKKAFTILRRELSRGEFVRFLQSIYKSEGDYTAEREALVGHLTVDQIVADIAKMRRAEGSGE